MVNAIGPPQVLLYNAIAWHTVPITAALAICAITGEPEQPTRASAVLSPGATDQPSNDPAQRCGKPRMPPH